MLDSLVFLYIYCINTIKAAASERVHKLIIAVGYKTAMAANNRRVAVFIKAVQLWHRTLLSGHKRDHLDEMDQIRSQEDIVGNMSLLAF